MAPAGNTHGEIAALLTGSLVQHVIAHQLGKIYAAETGFKISSDPDTVRAPDVAFIQQQRLQKIGPVEGYWPGAPDLVAEVVSPNDRYTDVEEKVASWLDAGTRIVIVINPRQRTVAVHRSHSDVHILSEDAMIDGADVVPGWSLTVGSLFA
jgi:Uma2 family endonuclease